MPLSLVSRCDSRKPVLIFDLDGTLLRVNSFPRWAMFLVRARFANLNFAERARIGLASLMLVLQRKARLMRHETLKHRLQALWQAATSGDGGAAERDFTGQLRSEVRPQFAPLLKAVAAGEVDAILATAAAGEYAQGFGRSLGFRHVLASMPGADNSGVTKKDAVLRLVSECGWQDRPRILFTDHADDLPLMHVCAETFWFGAETARRRIAQNMPDIVLHAEPKDSHEFST
jgi:phosphoserine phosphatase